MIDEQHAVNKPCVSRPKKKSDKDVRPGASSLLGPQKEKSVSDPDCTLQVGEVLVHRGSVHHNICNPCIWQLQN